MKITLKLRRLGFFLNLLLLCSCATTPKSTAIVPATELPAEVSINNDAGRGGFLTVPLRMEDGEELLFLVDTGSPWTLLDKSFEPKLGKRLGTQTAASLSDKWKSNVYAEPKLYLGSTPLMIGNIVTKDFKPQSSHSIMGILGLNCLRHYCVQLDFEAGKMRFLNSDQINAAELGKAFPLTFGGGHVGIHHSAFIGESTNLLIDTGCTIDGLAKKTEIKGQGVLLPECDWDGQTYAHLIVAAPSDWATVIGLDFLARHLVTLDFPKRTMYLKQTSVGPLDVFMNKSRLGGAMEFAESLKEKGQLPGFSKVDKGAVYLEGYSNFGSESHSNSDTKSETLDFGKNGKASNYHCVVDRVSQDSPWQLQKAWRTDQNGHTIEEYPIP